MDQSRTDPKQQEDTSFGSEKVKEDRNLHRFSLVEPNYSEQNGRSTASFPCYPPWAWAWPPNPYQWMQPPPHLPQFQGHTSQWPPLPPQNQTSAMTDVQQENGDMSTCNDKIRSEQ